jgi:hypothetical protein
VIEPGPIQSPDAIAAQEIAVGDERGEHAALPNLPNDRVDLGVEQRFAAAQRHDARAERGAAAFTPIVKTYGRRNPAHRTHRGRFRRFLNDAGHTVC